MIFMRKIITVKEKLDKISKKVDTVRVIHKSCTTEDLSRDKAIKKYGDYLFVTEYARTTKVIAIFIEKDTEKNREEIKNMYSRNSA